MAEEKTVLMNDATKKLADDESGKNNLQQSQEKSVQRSSKVLSFSSNSKSNPKFDLASFVSLASEKGYSKPKLARLCFRIDSLEKKYGLTYEEISTHLQEMGNALNSKNKELKSLEKEIEVAKKNKEELMQRYYLNEKQVQDYVDAKDKLVQFGIDINKLPEVKSCLIAIKKEGFDSASIISKLNSIGDLGSRKAALQNDLNELYGELRTKKPLLSELRKMQDTGLTVEQIERIRDIVARLSSSHGINPDQSFERFEKDVLTHYNVALGLESEVTMLQESKDALNAENNHRRMMYEQEEKQFTERIAKLERGYETKKAELKAYSELNASGVDGTRIIAWNELLHLAQINPELLDSELRKYGNLSRMEEETKSKIAELEKRHNDAEQSLKELEERKASLELSISSLKDSSISQMEQTSSKALSSMSDISKQASQTTESTREELKTTLSELKSAASVFSDEIKVSLKEVEPQLKSISQAIDAARQIGKYESMLPLLKLIDSSLSDRVTETEALVSMWNVCNAFNAWLKMKYPNEEVEIADPLSNFIHALDGEINSNESESESNKA